MTFKEPAALVAGSFASQLWLIKALSYQCIIKT